MGEIGDKTAASQSRQPGGSDRLQRFASHQCWQLTRKCCCHDGSPAFNHPQAGKGPAQRQRQLLALFTADADAIDLGDLDHHLRVHRCGGQQIHTRQRRHSHSPSSDPAVAIHDGLGLAAALAVQQVLGAVSQLAALQKNVVGQQFFPLLAQHLGEPAQQRFDFRQWLKRLCAWPGDALGGGAGAQDILACHQSCAAATQQLHQSAFLGLAAQIAFVEHQERAFAQIAKPLEHLKFTSPQVCVNHKQQQVSRDSIVPGLPLTLEPGITRLQNPRGVAQLNGPLQAAEAQAIALHGLGRAHGCSHMADLIVEQRPDQRCLAAGSAAEDHHHQITALQ